jgi:heme/copper-type cytochrome/quinol oxidase subunit 3
MRGLLFAVFFCGVSLLFAEVLATFLVRLSFVRPNQFDDIHNLMMIIMLVIYLVVSPIIIKNSMHHNNKDDMKM